MARETITKSHHYLTLVPNMEDYEREYRRFDWDSARDELEGLPNGFGVNIAHEAIDRNANGARRDQLAIRWIGKTGEVRDFTYIQLRGLTNHFADALHRLGVGKGDTVFTLLGRIPELYVVGMGTFKNLSVFCPLFSAFGPGPIKSRLEIGRAKVLVTTEQLYRRKIAPMRGELPFLEHVILVGENHQHTDVEGTLDYYQLIYEASGHYTIPPTDPEDVALLHFTSGTTGTPKGAVHVHQAVVAHYMTGRYALDFQDGDIFWCTADPGWVTGTSYGIIAPLVNGVTIVVDEAEFDLDRWYSIIQDQKVSVWYTAPTAIRMLMKAGAEATKGYDLSSLRFLASVGEPLNPEAVVWSLETFGLPFHDNWWQTETGGIMIANYPSMDIRPGSMGKPLPGIVARIANRGGEGNLEFVEEPDIEGELVVRAGWPSMFRDYLGEPDRYRNCFVDGWYLTGDLAKRDRDGYFWFVGRKDDVIKTSGHLIGPFEVESALMEHPAVAEAGVIGKPDPVAFEIVKAFVVLRPGFRAGEELNLDVLGFARSRLGAAVAPREIEFTEALPRTRSGKIMRRLLKARELGLPEGDLSMLESTSGD